MSQEYMYFLNDFFSTSTILLLLAVVIIASYPLKKKKVTGNPPPGPKGWPFFGNLLSLNYNSERVMRDWNREYGPVCSLKMAGVDFILLGTLEGVQEAFVKKGDVFSDRSQNSVGPFFGNHGLIFVSYTNKLKEQRRFGLGALREFGMGRRSIEPKILEKCSHLCEIIEKECDKGGKFRIEKMVYNTVASVISELVFNKNLPAQNDEFNKLLLRLVEREDYDVYSGILFFFPALKYIPPFRQAYTSSLEYHNAITRIIKEQVKEHRDTRDRNDPRDVIDCFLSEMDAIKGDLHSSEINENAAVELETSFVEDQLISLVRDLFLAGSETTSTTFSWLLLYVTRHPELQKTMQEEIDNVLGQGMLPSMSKADQLPYTRAVIQETLRIRPVAPVAIPHRASSDDTILGYDIKKDTIVLANLFAIHHDENIWEDSEKFDPRRHLDSNGKFIKSPHVIPFSIGPRQCLGQQLATMELFLIVVSVFQRFHFKLVDGEKVDIGGQNQFTLGPYPYEVIACTR